MNRRSFLLFDDLSTHQLAPILDLQIQTPSQRKEIFRLRDEKLTLKDISNRLNISINACHQALSHIKENKHFQNKKRPEKPRKTTKHLDRKIHRLSETNRFRTAVDIHSEIYPELAIPISVHTVRRRLVEFGLHGRVLHAKNHTYLQKIVKKECCLPKNTLIGHQNNGQKCFLLRNPSLIGLVQMENHM